MHAQRHRRHGRRPHRVVGQGRAERPGVGLLREHVPPRGHSAERLGVRVPEQRVDLPRAGGLRLQLGAPLRVHQGWRWRQRR